MTASTRSTHAHAQSGSTHVVGSTLQVSCVSHHGRISLDCDERSRSTPSTVVFTDTYYPVSLNGKEYSHTIGTSACELLVHGPKCDVCKKYRSSLRSLHSQWMSQLNANSGKHLPCEATPTTAICGCHSIRSGCLS